MNQLTETGNRNLIHHGLSRNNTSSLYLFIQCLNIDHDPERWENSWCGNMIRTESSTEQSKIIVCDYHSSNHL